MTVDFTKYTDRARKVLRNARNEAEALNHQCLGTEHILLGLATEKHSVAYQALTQVGITPEKLRSEVALVVQHGPPLVTMGQLPFTPRTKRALELATEEAIALRHSYIGTEHLLLGLLREGEGIASQVLLGMGVVLDELRKTVLEIVGVKP